MNGLPPECTPGYGRFSPRDVAARRLPARTGRDSRESALYILEFTSGLIKVGRSAEPLKRIEHHVRSAARFTNGSLVQGWLSAPHANVLQNELQLIAFGRSISKSVSGNEYLFGADFQTLVDFAARLTYVPSTLGPETESEWDGSIRAAVEALWAAPAKSDADKAPTLPPPAEGDPFDQPGYYEEFQRLADVIGDARSYCFKDVAEMSWLDLQEFLIEVQVERYAAEGKLAFAKLRAAVIQADRQDLLAPLIPNDHWIWSGPGHVSGDSEPVARAEQGQPEMTGCPAPGDVLAMAEEWCRTFAGVNATEAAILAEVLMSEYDRRGVALDDAQRAYESRRWSE